MFGFLIAIVAGAISPMLEGPLARPVARIMGENVEVQPDEMRTLAFMIALIIAGVFCALFDSGSALGLAIGGALGFFIVRLGLWLQRTIEGNRR